jgi:hypothetical protein
MASCGAHDRPSGSAAARRSGPSTVPCSSPLWDEVDWRSALVTLRVGSDCGSNRCPTLEIPRVITCTRWTPADDPAVEGSGSDVLAFTAVRGVSAGAGEYGE